MDDSPVFGDKQSIRARAFEIIKKHSFRFGDFTLSSGAKSTYYLDMKPSMFHPEGVAVLAQLVLDRIEGLNVDYIGGMEMGAVPLIAPVVLLSGNRLLSGSRHRPISGFFVRQQKKKHGTQKLVEAPEGALSGTNVVILDDVTTTGDSAMQAAKAAEDERAKVALVLSIVDREAGANELFRKADLPFDALFRASAFLPR